MHYAVSSNYLFHGHGQTLVVESSAIVSCHKQGALAKQLDPGRSRRVSWDATYDSSLFQRRINQLGAKERWSADDSNKMTVLPCQASQGSRGRTCASNERVRLGVAGHFSLDPRSHSCLDVHRVVVQSYCVKPGLTKASDISVCRAEG